MNIDPTKIEALKGIFKKPHVNSSCIGCSACVAITSGDYFDLDDDWLSIVKGSVGYEESLVEDSIASCPVNAITWQPCDENGNYLNGIQEHRDV